LSDSYFGKYKTIVSLSLVYCLGISFLSVQSIPGFIAKDPPAWSAILAMVLIAVGTGGIKVD
jgi:dipeptide/tripeptide permease